MKKFLTSIVIALCCAGAASAQDLESVIGKYNEAATTLNDGNTADALSQFNAALEAATALGEEGANVVNDCKTIIPKLYLQIGKENAEASSFEAAIENFNKAISLAKEYENNADAVAEATSLIPKMMMAQAGALLTDKNYDAAAEVFAKVTELDPENGTAFFRLGQSLAAANKVDEAVAAFTEAAAKGEEDKANKQLANIFLKKAVACQKAKDMKGVLENAQESAKFNNSANAQKMIGMAALSLKQNQVAADAYESYLALSPNAKDKEQTMYQLGTALVGVGANEKACGYFKQIKDDKTWGEAARYQITVLKCN